MSYRPSSLPMLAACPCFESGPTEWTEGGTNRHSYLHTLWIRHNELNGAAAESMLRDAAEKLSEEEIDACQWAYDYIKNTAALLDNPIHFERKMSCELSDWSVMEGTPDVVCGRDLFDLKWRERDYHAQMAAYALMMMQADPALPFVRVHIMFGAFRRVETVYSLDRNQAEWIVEETIATTQEKMIETAIDGTRTSSIPSPRSCEYCGWCKKQLTCPAFTKPVAEAVREITKFNPPQITQWNPAEMKTAEEISFGLTMVRNILKPYCGAMEKRALHANLVEGISLEPDYVLAKTKGRSAVTDVQGAFALVGVPQEDFFRACEVRMNTSKTYPDRVGLTEIFAAKNEMKKAPAKRALLAKLAPVIMEGKDGWKLKSVKGNEEEETE